MKIILLSLVFTFSAYAINAQDCPKYAKLIGEGNSLAGKGAFIEALNKYYSAQTHCKSKADEVQGMIKAMFLKINKLKINAEK